MSSISVKIPKAKLISELKASIEKKKALLEQYLSEEERFNKEMAEFPKKALQSIKKGTATIEFNPGYFSYSHFQGSNSITATVRFTDLTIPKKNEAFKNANSESIKRTIREIEQNIKLLELSDQEHVNATTYKHIIKYL